MVKIRTNSEMIYPLKLVRFIKINLWATWHRESDGILSLSSNILLLKLETSFGMSGEVKAIAYSSFWKMGVLDSPP